MMQLLDHLFDAVVLCYRSLPVFAKAIPSDGRRSFTLDLPVICHYNGNYYKSMNGPYSQVMAYIIWGGTGVY